MGERHNDTYGDVARRRARRDEKPDLARRLAGALGKWLVLKVCPQCESGQAECEWCRSDRELLEEFDGR